MYLVEPQPRRLTILEYLTKGKGKEADAVRVGAKRERPRYSSGPNPNFPDFSPDEDSTDEGITTQLNLTAKYLVRCYNGF